MSPSSPLGERNPFRFLECSVQGGDRYQIEDPDIAIAWSQDQLPAVRMSWSSHMEVHDLYPVTTLTHTWPTGTKVEIPMTECPHSFVNPMDPVMIEHVRRCCVELIITYKDCFSFSYHKLHMHSLAQWQHTQTRSTHWCGISAMLSDWVVCCWMCATWSHHIRCFGHWSARSIRSPLHSNQPVWPDAELVRGYYWQTQKQSSNQDWYGIADGDSMTAVGHVIRRIVWVHVCMRGRIIYTHRFMIIRQPTTTSLMWRGMHFLAQGGLAHFITLVLLHEHYAVVV